MLRKILIAALVLSIGVAVVHRPLTPQEIVARALPAVTSIDVLSKGRPGIGFLSGMVIGKECDKFCTGYILTAAHGFEYITKNNRVTVYFWNDHNIPYYAKIIKKDHELDIAILQVKMMPKDIPVIEIGGDIYMGERVLALGHPARIENTVTVGVSSGYKQYGDKRDYYVLQFSAEIAPGSSGGPVLNDRAQLIGMTISRAQFFNKAAFAVPSDLLHAYTRNLPGRRYGLMCQVSDAIKRFIQSNSSLLGWLNENNRKPNSQRP